MAKPYDQSSIKRKWLIWLVLPHHCTVSKRSGKELTGSGSWRQDMMQRPWRDDVYWLTPVSLRRSFFLNPRPQAQWCQCSQWELSPTHQLLIKKMYYSWNYESMFFQMNSGLLCDSSLFLVDIKISQDNLFHKLREYRERIKKRLKSYVKKLVSLHLCFCKEEKSVVYTDSCFLLFYLCTNWMFKNY